MTGHEFAAAGLALAHAYARLRPGGDEWLAAWRADDPDAADELAGWELEGHPFHPATWSTNAMTVTEALHAMLALYAAPGSWIRTGIAKDAAGQPVAPESREAAAWSLEGALYRVVGDPEADGITEAEWSRREALASGVFRACGVDLMAFNDAARCQRVVTDVLRGGLDHVSM